MPPSSEARRMCFAFHELHCSKLLVVMPSITVFLPPFFANVGKFVCFAEILSSASSKLDSNRVYATSVKVWAVVWPTIRVVMHISERCLFGLVCKLPLM